MGEHGSSTGGTQGLSREGKSQTLTTLHGSKERTWEFDRGHTGDVTGRRRVKPLLHMVLLRENRDSDIGQS